MIRWNSGSPPESGRDDDNHRSHYHANELLRSETKQQHDNHAEPNRPHYEQGCDGHADETHHKKAHCNQHPGKFRVHPHKTEWTRMSVSGVILHHLIVRPVHSKSSDFCAVLVTSHYTQNPRKRRTEGAHLRYRLIASADINFNLWSTCFFDLGWQV